MGRSIYNYTQIKVQPTITVEELKVRRMPAATMHQRTPMIMGSRYAPSALHLHYRSHIRGKEEEYAYTDRMYASRMKTSMSAHAYNHTDDTFCFLFDVSQPVGPSVNRSSRGLGHIRVFG